MHTDYNPHPDSADGSDVRAGELGARVGEARRLYAARAFLECESVCGEILAKAPRRLDVLVMLGDARAARGAVDAAAEAYRRAQEVVPGHSLPFTRLTCLAWRRKFGSAPQPRPIPAGARRIQMTSLGANGRFGNQLLQYGFLTLYARRHGLTAEVPEWIGRYLYGFDDPTPRGSLPTVDEQQIDLFAALHGPPGSAPHDINLQGYFCGDMSRWGNVADEFRSLFQLAAAIRTHLDALWGKLLARGDTVVAIHVRRGDFGHGRFWIAPSSWYREWLARLWSRLARPVLYIATDDPDVADEFRDYDPVLAGELDSEANVPSLVLDHFVLSQAENLAISNSSFSFTAAMLNAAAREFRRPDPDRRCLVPFDPWRAPVLLDPADPTPALAAGERTLLSAVIAPGHTVVHMGSHCSAWTTALRGARPFLRVHELDAEGSLDEFRKRSGIAHINHVRIESADALSNVIDSARESLQDACIDLFHLPDDIAMQVDAAVHLQAAGYRFFHVDDQGQITEAGSPRRLKPAPHIAVHERLIPLFRR